MGQRRIVHRYAMMNLLKSSTSLTRAVSAWNVTSLRMAGTRQDAVSEISATHAYGLDPAESKFNEGGYGSLVFDADKMARYIKSDVEKHLTHFEDFRAGRVGRINEDTADVIAEAAKDWAVEEGCTHYAHFFHPLSGAGGEKHDSFLTKNGDFQFDGEQMFRGEPDGSSFPGGGLRCTHQARGYTTYSPESDIWIRRSTNCNTLMIPTAFTAWSGVSLDYKTPLSTSLSSVKKQVERLMILMGENDFGEVSCSVGSEQEFFIMDRRLFLLRPDLVATGRTLLGADPPKGQGLDDHYFTNMHERVMAFLNDLEQEMWALKMPLTTRHAEVAPGQYEMAPIFSSCEVAADQNLMFKQISAEIARRHDLEILLHEKPFAGLNGSGKHQNWSIDTTKHRSLFKPGKDPINNLPFVAALACVIRGVDVHPDLLRLGATCSGNDHRLGAQEAPPAIMSMSLGVELTNMIHTLLGEPVVSIDEFTPDAFDSVVNNLGHPGQGGDRNRTSPFAFVGNKFEFRAVGSTQAIAWPNTLLNVIMSDSLEAFSNSLEVALKSKGVKEAVHEVAAEFIRNHRRVIFEGDGYSQEWAAEARQRGLPEYKNTVAAIEQLAVPKNVEVFEKTRVLTAPEVHARAEVMFEQYVGDLSIEAKCMLDLAKTMVAPVGVSTETKVGAAAIVRKQHGLNGGHAESLTREIVQLNDELGAGIKNLENALENALAAGDAHQSAKLISENVVPAMAIVRNACDTIETLADDKEWPLPKYREMLFIK